MEFLRAIGKESITICEVLGVDASIPSRKIRLTLRGRTIWVDYFDGASSFVERLVQLNPEIEVGGQWDHISDTHSRSHAALTEGEQCWSCDRRPANPASAATVYMTRKALPTGDQTAEVVVPRCSACESIDRLRTWLSLGGFVLGIAIAFPLAMTWSSLGIVTWLVSPVVLGVLCPTLLPMLWPEVRTLRLIRNAPSVARMEAQGWKVASVKGEATISIEGGD
jgi:hypothetical protein